MADEQLYDVFSNLDENHNPILGTCTLVVGDGTVKVDFNNGRAQVPGSVAAIISRNPSLQIPGFTDKLEKLEAEVGSEPAEEVRQKVERDDRDLDEEIKLAQEHLAEEGEEVPEPKPGFDATTAEGQPRCQAAKADGSQCKNPAAEDSTACGLSKHQEQLAS